MDSLYLIPEMEDAWDQERTDSMLERAAAMCRTAEFLGLELALTKAEAKEAEATALAFAINPDMASKATIQEAKLQKQNAQMVFAGSILRAYKERIVNDSQDIRNLVTNKLLLETEHNDARVRLRALEMLGKSSDVGLFTEKREVVVTDGTSNDLREALREKLLNALIQKQLPAGPLSTPSANREPVTIDQTDDEK